jgi:hypothetical protein
MTTVMDASKQREIDCTWLQYSDGPEGGVGRDHDVFQFWMKRGGSDLIAYCEHGQEASDSRVRDALPNPDMPLHSITWSAMANILSGMFRPSTLRF